MTSKSRRIRDTVLSMTGAAALIGVMAMPASTVFAQTTPTVQTIAGANRMETAIAVAQQEYPSGPSSHTAIIASGANANLVDSVTAAPLAKALGAPILLSESTSILSTATANYLSSNGITTVYLVGAAANSTLQAALPKTVTSVKELTGANRYATATAIAQALLTATGQTSFSTVFVASGQNSDLSDALAAAPFAANQVAPILFAAPNSTSLPSPESGLVTNQSSQTMYVVGAATGYGLQTSDTSHNVGSSSNSTFANAAAIAQQFAPSSGFTTVDVGNDSQTETVDANGTISYHLVDAITGAPLAAMQHAAIVFTNGATITPSTESFLKGSDGHGIANVNLFGGTASIPTSTGDQAAQYVVQGVPTVPTLSSINLSGQSFGSGSETAPAVASTSTPLTLSATLTSNSNSALTGVDLTLTLMGSQQPVVTNSGTTLQGTQISGGWTYQVPTNSSGTSTVNVSLPTGESASYTAQFSAPFTVNGQALTDSVDYLQFVAPNSVAIAPFGTSSAPYAVPVSTTSNPSQGVVPVTVTLPPLNGAAQTNVPVTLTLSSNSASAYITGTQGSGNFGTSYTAYTNSNGQANFFVDANAQGEATATASVNNSTSTQQTVLEWGQSGVPSTVSLSLANGQGSGTAFTATNGATATFNGTVTDVLGNAVPNAKILVTASGANGASAGDYVSGTTDTAFPTAAPVSGAIVSSTGSPYGDLVTANSQGTFSIPVTDSSAAVTYQFWYVQNGEVASVGQQASGKPLASATVTYSAANPTVPTKVQASLSPNPGTTGALTGIDVPANTTQAVYFDAQNSSGADILSSGAAPNSSVTYEVSTSAGTINGIDGVALTGSTGAPPSSSVQTVTVQGGTTPTVTVDGVNISKLSGFALPDGSNPGVIGTDVTDTTAGTATVTAAVANISSATAAIDFTAGQPAGVSVSPSTLTVSPGTASTVTLTVTDAGGSPVANAAVPLMPSLGSQNGLWLTAVNGTNLTTTAVYGGTTYSNASTPIPLYSKTNLAYSGVDIANTVAWSPNHPIYVYTNSQGQVTLTLQAGAAAYLAATSSSAASTTISNPAASNQS
ncbi:MAG: cell wall-binding repeat-containing protein, partial [Thermaerobacter sp.]|nr:cell wall-binding repeat-containing protein [Thermaerobacter sp.]